MTVEDGGHYETQGYYPLRRYEGRGRKWATHIRGMTLEQAHRCYTWFAYHCMDPDWDSPNAARIVNSLTGEVLEPPVLHTPERLPGTKMKTIPCTAEEFDVAMWRIYLSTGWHCSRNLRPRKDGWIVYSHGRDNVVGYKLPDGSYRIRPSNFRPAPKEREHEEA